MHSTRFFLKIFSFIVLLSSFAFCACSKGKAIAGGDPVKQPDTGNNTRDTLIIRDTLIKRNTIFKKDTLVIRDSIIRTDTIITHLKSIVKDTTIVRDTTVKYDTIVNKDPSNGANPPGTNPPGTGPPGTNPPGGGTQRRTLALGSGYGDLIIDGSNLVVDGNRITFQNNDLVKIKGGGYNSITIRNISVPDGQRVEIVNDGTVQLNGNNKLMTLGNLNNVTLAGNGTAGTDRGFVFLNNSYRAIIMEGTINNFTLRNMLFKNIGDYVINYNDLDKRIYNGSDNSYLKNLAFLNLDADNTGPFINLEGDITNSNFTGFISNVEVGYITCMNSPNIGTVVFLGNCENYNVHDNLVNNINTQNNNHNGIFMLRGNGRFYRNIVKNHQGNAIRSWLYSIRSAGSVEIYNNIVYNSRKYSAFELQVPPYIKASPLFRAVNAKVYNNTVGRMNTEKNAFPGDILDLYDTYGTLEFYNNLAFEDNDANLINNMSGTSIINNSNNVYKTSLGDAVTDNINFTSKISGAGASF